MKKSLILAALFTATFWLAGCNTIEGLGEDIKAASRGIRQQGDKP